MASDGSKTLVFADEYVAPILSGEKTATVRYNDGGAIEVGDTVPAVMESGTQFATLEITRTATVLAVEAMEVLELFAANYPTETVKGLINGVDQHYDDPIGPETLVRVIIFEEVDDA
ncbi:ASCH domain-containing protein [Halosimplex pelagicum]|uniref:ASCH domain-containing protein n=1 Tax=Halosimplex pelagicum TaxID=869886 RepID=A0A7D5TR60_9EURY|nr:ASCH domain-containing protein [Halosimplex pelagicum]QLH81012.1 ASCH domain-containing protein [Halosimplex pelagicum]